MGQGGFQELPNQIKFLTTSLIAISGLLTLPTMAGSTLSNRLEWEAIQYVNRGSKNYHYQTSAPAPPKPPAISASTLSASAARSKSAPAC